jgi:hypothetical protein
MALFISFPAYADYTVPDGTTGDTVAATAPAEVSNVAATTVEPEENETGVAYDPVAGTPPCQGVNSTCITGQTIANAKHAFVQDSPVKSYISLILPPDGEECQAPVKSGVSLRRAWFDGTDTQIKEYDDAFCLNQGCVYFGLEGDQRCE